MTCSNMLILSCQRLVEASNRIKEVEWVEDRVNVMHTDGLTLEILMKVVIREYEEYRTT